MKNKMKFGRPYKPIVSQKKKRKISRFAVAVLILTFIIYTLCSALAQLSAAVERVSEKLLELNATRIINDSVTNTINGGINYDNLVDIWRTESGEIASVTANAAELNKLKATVTSDLLKSFENLGARSFSVPLGNLTDTLLLSGVGPRIPFKLIPYGSATVNFRNAFTSTGINQTRHEIFIDVTADIGAVSSVARVRGEVSTSILASQTVIVGKVPQFFHGGGYEQTVKD